MSAANFIDIKEAATTFRSLDAYSISPANLTGVDEPLSRLVLEIIDEGQPFEASLAP